MSGIEWTCVKCGFPIADGAGYVHVSMNAVGSVEAAQSEWEDEYRDQVAVTLDEMSKMPRDVNWLAHHDGCDPDPFSLDYFIPIAGLRTHEGLLGWTAHLMEKSWIGYTNWIAVIRSKVRGTP